MQIGFFVCNEKAAKEFIYADNSVFERKSVLNQGEQKEMERFCVESAMFSLEEDIWVEFRMCEGTVCFLKHSDCAYQLLQGEKEVRGESYGESEQNVFSIITIHRERLWMYLCFSEFMYASLYQTGIGEISVGRGSDNTICCPQEDMLSERHLCIKGSGQGILLLMEGRNGGYLNHTYLGRNARAVLQYGDQIQLFGWTILWLGELLSIYSLRGTEVVAALEECGLLLPLSKEESRNNYFNKSITMPRSHLLPDRESIELETPFFGDIILPLCEEKENELYGYLSSATCNDVRLQA